jgi:hypothetical protein
MDAQKTDEFEKIFQNITSIVLGKKLTNYRDYEVWLNENVAKMEKTKSCISEKIVYLPPAPFYTDTRKRAVTIEEGYEILGKRQLSERELTALSLANAEQTLRDISITTPDTQYGTNSNMVECPLYYNSVSCFRSSALNQSRYALYSFWPRKSEYVLGCYYAFSSQFCIKCYNSENLTRCFEVSDSNNCSDAYFCHNCDGLDNAIFCFNTKAKRYAICNVEVGREEFMRVKKMLLAYLYEGLEKTKSLELNIYNLGNERA